MPTVRQFPDWPAGSICRFEIRSAALENNPWNDPADRVLNVYLPPGYDEGASPYIALWDLAAFTTSGPGHLNWRHHGENLQQRLDRLIHQEQLPPLVVAMPDCYTSLGGNQYLNSASVGQYEDHVIGELVPLLSERLNIINSRDGRGAFGKSSGGYGALVLAMRHPDVFGAVAAHAADMGFELVYRPEFPSAAGVLKACKGDVSKFLKQFWKNRKRGKADYATLMTVAMAASYDPNEADPEAIQLPFDLDTCQLDMKRWNNWLAHDPVNMVEDHADALRSLHGLYVDVGNRDEYNIQYGTRRLARKLEELGVRHHFEEFDGSHMGLDWRLDFSLPYLAKALLTSTEQND